MDIYVRWSTSFPCSSWFFFLNLSNDFFLSLTTKQTKNQLIIIFKFKTTLKIQKKEKIWKTSSKNLDLEKSTRTIKKMKNSKKIVSQPWIKIYKTIEFFHEFFFYFFYFLYSSTIYFCNWKCSGQFTCISINSLRS